jgi:chitinase
VTLSAVSGIDAVVGYATSDGTATAGTDYVAVSGTLTIPAGATTATVDVTVDGDTLYEANETFSLALLGPTDASVGDGDALATIVNDDRAPTTITIAVSRGRKLVTASGILEPTQAGHRVTVALLKLRSGRFVRVAAKTVTVKKLLDRDGDGKVDGKYVASFTRPVAGGTYKLVATFKGGPSFKPSTRSKRFKLAPR